MLVQKAAGQQSTGANATIAFNTTDFQAMTAIFQYLLSKDAPGAKTKDTRPDWWWTDGSLHQWATDTGNGENVHNLFMMVYLHSMAIRYGADATNNRPVVMPRHTVLGHHRYCCGFSGDAASDWVTLSGEVLMTPTAANVLFGYWSHDIGGFVGDPSAEMYARWAQFGAVSPIWRSHGRKGNERRYWMFDTFPIIKESMVFRATLAPLLYTLAAASYKTGVAFVHATYHNYPEHEQAYNEAYQFQYMLGDDVVVRPVVEAVDNSTGVATTQVWLPPSEDGWVSWNTSEAWDTGANGTVVTIDATVADLPVFVRGGTVLPLLPVTTLDVTDATKSTRWVMIPSLLFLGVAPHRARTAQGSARGRDHAEGAVGSATRYWDDGTSTDYELGKSATQEFAYEYVSTGGAGSDAATVHVINGTIKAAVTSGGFVIDLDNQDHRHMIEVRGAATNPPTRATFNGVAGTITVTKDHSLARSVPCTCLFLQPGGISHSGPGSAVFLLRLPCQLANFPTDLSVSRMLWWWQADGFGGD